ncbi:MAG: hypothetical protein IT363_11415 [Methanoregulaceae archaeon]|nr:hypothetical protein [Methanoregulaceae archaeon]
MHRVMRYVSLGLLALVILACGGSGSGSGVPGSTLVIETDWRLRGLPGGGLSQRVSLLDARGIVVRSLAVDSRSAEVESVRIDGIPAGSYRFTSTLFSLAGLSGTAVGVLELPIQVSGETRLPIAVGAAAASVQVLPTTAEITVPQSTRFYANQRTSSGAATFSPLGAFIWTTSGTAGNVNSEGVFQSSAAGSATVTVRAPNAQTADAAVTVRPAQTQTSRWTVLVYMSAASDLYPFSDLNVNQMERVAGNDQVRFVVQWKQSRARYPSSSFDGTRRYLVRPDGGNAIASQVVQDLGGTVDMGKWPSLREFVQWGKTYYPAERTVLVIWGHGNGWRRKPDQPMSRAVAYDDERGSAIQIWDLKKALAGIPVDILAWDASLMQMMEVAYEVRDVCDFVVGSEESPPAEGYPYDAVFGRFRDAPTAPTRDLTKAFVDAMLAAPGYASRKITQSVLETSQLSALERAVDSLAAQLIMHGGALTTVIPQVRATAQAYTPQSAPPRYYRDLYDVCLKLEAATTIADVKAAAAQVRARLLEAIAWEGHNANSPGSRGVSIDFTPGQLFLNAASDYQQLEFGRVNRWDDWMAMSP